MTQQALFEHPDLAGLEAEIERILAELCSLADLEANLQAELAGLLDQHQAALEAMPERAGEGG